MTAAPIIPTHACFDDAIDYFEQVMNVDRLPEVVDDYRVVHGILLGADSGEPFAHAWVEQRNVRTYFTSETPGVVVPERVAWQAGMIDAQRVYFALELAAFLRDYRVARATRYSVRLACECNKLFGHYGPWRSEYIELCRKNGDGRILGIVQSGKPVIIIAVHPTGISIAHDAAAVDV